MTTRLEKLAPEITALAASIGQEVCYWGGDYFMHPSQRSLWNTRYLGPLTQEGADAACRGLAFARMVSVVTLAQARPVAERIEAVARMLVEARWQPRHIVEVTTAALDLGTLSRWMGQWDVCIGIVGRPKVEVRDHSGTRAEAIDAARSKALEGAL